MYTQYEEIDIMSKLQEILENGEGLYDELLADPYETELEEIWDAYKLFR